MICAAEHKSAAPLTPTDAATSPWHLQNTKIHMELFASPIENRINTMEFFFLHKHTPGLLYSILDSAK